MSGIFLSYRRSDSEGYAGRLFEGLKTRCDADQLFFDVAAIAPGEDFHKVIADKVGSCAVLLALIGKNWLSAVDEHGRRRLDNGDDFVRLEIAAALKRSIAVIPVLLQGAAMPRDDELPSDLAGLARLNALELRHTRWEADFAQLLATLARFVTLREPGKGLTRRRWVKAGLWLVALFAVLAALLFWFARVEVPALVGLPLETAKAVLLAEHLGFSIVEADQLSPTASHVLNQRPRAGDLLARGNRVDLEVNRPGLIVTAPAAPSPARDPAWQQAIAGTWWARHTALNGSYLDIRYTLLPGGRVNWQGNLTYGWQKTPLILSGTWQVKDGRLETVVESSNVTAIIANGYRGSADIIDITADEFTYFDQADQKMYVDTHVK